MSLESINDDCDDDDDDAYDDDVQLMWMAVKGHLLLFTLWWMLMFSVLCTGYTCLYIVPGFLRTFDNHLSES